MSEHRHAVLEATSAGTAIFKGMKIQGDLDGSIFTATIEQRFVNETDRPMEVVYTFPLPERAIVLGVEVELGATLLESAIVGRDTAEERYEDALAEGNAAIMLELLSDGSYCMNLGNLLAGETCRIRVRYTQLMRFEQGGLRLMIPTVLAPRYGNPIKDAGLLPHQVAEASLTAEHPLEVAIRIHAELANASISSPSHALVCSKDANTDVVTVTVDGTPRLDRDIVLVLEQLPKTSFAASQPDPHALGRNAVIASVYPQIEGTQTKPVTAHILVDCSGSMSGESISAARAALGTIFATLDDSDRFSLSKFGTHVKHEGRTLMVADAAGKRTANRWLATLEADMGGTELEVAIDSTMALSTGQTADLFLITDGNIHAIDGVLAHAIASKKRVFVIGIGSAPTENNLRRLADETQGACDFVAPGEDVAPAVQRMFSRLRAERLTNLKLHWSGASDPVWSALPPGAVFAGDTVHLSAQFEGAPPDTLTLTATDDAGSIRTLGVASVRSAPQGLDDLARIAVSMRLHALHPEVRRATAVQYQLLCGQTNAILVHERDEAERTDGLPNLHVVRPMLPAGWGGVGSVLMAHAAPPRWSSRADSTPSFSMDSRPDGSSWGLPSIWRRLTSRETQLMTPRRFQTWLSAHPPEQWPTTTVALRELGMPSELITWLDFLELRFPGSKISEAEIVGAFIEAVRQHLGQAGNTASRMSTASPLVREIVSALQGTNARHWSIPALFDTDPSKE